MVKVKISLRQVYFKTTSVEIDIPKDITTWYSDIGTYLNENPELYADKVMKNLKEEDYEEGIGMETGAWTDSDMDAEWRFDCKELKTGGHV
tara:strand:- start:5090 stop:5362 length:273 start_codon:yes stop_codon:yes gene_type:complete